MDMGSRRCGLPFLRFSPTIIIARDVGTTPLFPSLGTGVPTTVAWTESYTGDMLLRPYGAFLDFAYTLHG